MKVFAYSPKHWMPTGVSLHPSVESFLQSFNRFGPKHGTWAVKQKSSTTFIVYRSGLIMGSLCEKDFTP